MVAFAVKVFEQNFILSLFIVGFGAQRRPARTRLTRLTASTELLVDADSHSIDLIRQAISLLNERDSQVQTTLFAPPRRVENERWSEFVKEPGVVFSPVHRSVEHSAEPNDEAIEMTMRAFAAKEDVRCIALLTSDNGFADLVEELQTSGVSTVVLIPDGKYGVLRRYSATNTTVLPLQVPRENLPRVRAVLDTAGGGYVHLADPYAAFDNDSVAASVRQFLQDFGYRREGDQGGYLLQASAKFWFANRLGSLTVFPFQLATVSVHEMMQAREHYECYSGDLAFLLPVSSTGKRTKGCAQTMDPAVPARSFVVVALSFCKIRLSCRLKFWEGLATLTMSWMMTWQKRCFAFSILRPIKHNCDYSVFCLLRVPEVSTYAASSVPPFCPMAAEDCGSTSKKTEMTRILQCQFCGSCEKSRYLAPTNMTNLKCSKLWTSIRKDVDFHACRHLMAFLIAFCAACRPIRPKGMSLKSGSALAEFGGLLPPQFVSFVQSPKQTRKQSHKERQRGISALQSSVPWVFADMCWLLTSMVFFIKLQMNCSDHWDMVVIQSPFPQTKQFTITPKVPLNRTRLRRKVFACRTARATPPKRTGSWVVLVDLLAHGARGCVNIMEILHQLKRGSLSSMVFSGFNVF